MAKRKVPNVLNFVRSIVPSEGQFSVIVNEGGKESKQPLLIGEKTVLGTLSSYANVYKKETLNEETFNKEQSAGENNIQRIDSCHLPQNSDTFELEFSLKFLPNSLGPDRCNDPDFRVALERLTRLFAEKGGYRELAKRYLAQVCNGSFLWRNRYGINRTITLTAPFNPDLRPETLPFEDTFGPVLSAETEKRLNPWIDRIGAALTNPNTHFLMKIVARVTIGAGQEVYPSQEFEDAGQGRGKKSKVLFRLTFPSQGIENVAGLHSQKIGNAIRTIDTWYSDSGGRPLAVDPYTFDKSLARCQRLPGSQRSRSALDFYSFLMDIDQLIKEVESASDASKIPGHVYYTVASFIRGGVYSGEKKEKPEKSVKEEQAAA